MPMGISDDDGGGLPMFTNYRSFLYGKTGFDRWELYNIFNHTQFDGVDTTARFDPQGRQINQRFGQITSARNSREMQLSLRVEF